MNESDNTTAVSGDAVDWSTIPDDVECARCGYNLRGLERSRCPECGLEFDWEEVLNPNLRPHPYLYEHHGGRRKFRRLIRTVVASWKPWRFWRTMRMTHQRFPGRLAAYAVILAVLGAAGACTAVALTTLGAALYQYTSSAPPILSTGAPTVWSGGPQLVATYMLRNSARIGVNTFRISIAYSLLVVS